jgi:hypothetical protein
VVFSDQVPDTTDTVHMFQLTGPGVDLQTDMDGGDNKSELYSTTLEPNSVYTFQDTDQPGLGTVVFNTSGMASGVPSGSTGAGSPSPGATSPGSSRPSSSSSVSSNVSITATAPSASRLAYRGTLSASVSEAGTLALSYRGKSVSSLVAGRYTVAVDDRSPRSGFILQELTHPPLSLSGPAFTGRRSERVDLTAGQWFFYPALLGKKTYFLVVK